MQVDDVVEEVQGREAGVGPRGVRQVPDVVEAEVQGREAGVGATRGMWGLAMVVIVVVVVVVVVLLVGVHGVGRIGCSVVEVVMRES